MFTARRKHSHSLNENINSLMEVTNEQKNKIINLEKEK